MKVDGAHLREAVERLTAAHCAPVPTLVELCPPGKESMGGGTVRTAGSATVEVFWRAYGTLKRAERAALAERILRDRDVVEDVFDHFLIEKAKKVQGKSVTLDEYWARREQP